jgi:predicted naringenin-chalcone synthase
MHMLEWTDSAALTVPAQRDLLRFEQRGGLLRNILSPAVPELAATHARSVLDQVMARHALSMTDISGWVWHGGGKTVIDALQSRLGLQDEDVRLSRGVLADYGNLSSAFVFFVLEASLAEVPRPGWWWMSSFGAGFSCHGALLRLSPFPDSVQG